MAKFNNKITSLINSQVPDFILDDHPKFVQFLKSYYTFMEAAELSVENVQRTDGIQLETETNQENNLLLDGSRIDSDRTQLDSGDKIILESSIYGKFTRGEIVRGETSNATSTILTEDLDNGRLFITAQDKFIIGETIIGLESNATTTVKNYKPNPVNNIQDLLNFRDPDKVISNFLTKFRNELLNTIPESLDINVNKRTLLKNVKSLYRLKGTSLGHKVFFRLLFGLESEITYPREQLLRVSDGKWNTSKILRAIVSTGDGANLIGRTITGQASSATAIIESIFKFQIGSDEVTEFILNKDSIYGTFTVGEEIRGTQTDNDDTYIKATITGLPNIPTISNAGSLYSEGDDVTIVGGGEGSIIQIGAVGRGGITEFFIDDAGTGYSIGDDIVFTNTNTGGGAATAKISIVNGGFVNEDSSGDRIILEDETTRGDPYTGNTIVQETATGVGDITDIRIINKGSNYISLPTVTVSSTGGVGAVVKAYGSEIGKVLSVKIVEPGKNHQLSPTPPTLKLPVNVLFVDRSGIFSIGETVSALGSDGSTVVTAKVDSVNNNTNIIILTEASGTFGVNVVLTGLSSGALATIKKFDQATATTTVTSVLDTAGTYINQDGQVSENTMRIQDSLLYQDFSYIVKVGRTINDWRDSFKKTIHSAGFYFQGQVNISTQVSAKLRNVIGVNTGYIGEPILTVINLLFTTIFGRRLGTVDDGTTLSVSPQLGQSADFNTSTISPFSNTTRDVTLKRDYKISFHSIAKISIRGDESKYGYAYSGPRMRSLNIYNNPFGTNNMFSPNHPNIQNGTVGADSTVASYISGMKMINWADHRIVGTNSNINGTGVQIQDYNNNNLKTYLAYPTQISISY